MASERERIKRLKALVRKTVGMGAKITPKDARKIVSIGEECLPKLSEIVRDETVWNRYIENSSSIDPLLATFLIGSIGSEKGFDDLTYVLKKHHQDIDDLVSQYLTSSLAICGKDKSESIYGFAKDRSLPEEERYLWVDVLTGIAIIWQGKRSQIEDLLVGLIQKSRESNRFNAYVIDNMLNLQCKASLPVILEMFDGGYVDESMISRKDVEEGMNFSDGINAEELYPPPMSFFEKETIMDLLTEGNDEDDDSENDTVKLLANMRRMAESILRKTNRNDLCPCGRGKKYKNCCEPYVNERKKINASEEMGRRIINNYVESEENIENFNDFEKAGERFENRERILNQNDVELLLDWYIHDYTNGKEGKSVIERIIAKQGKELAQSDVELLRNWSNSRFSLYIVLSIRWGVGYTVEDMFLEPGKRIFVADVSSSLLIPRFELLFIRPYSFGRISRTAGGLVNLPYSLKDDAQNLISGMYREYSASHGFSDHTDDMDIKKEFLKEMSLDIIQRLWEMLEKYKEEDNNKQIYTNEGHIVKISEGKFRVSSPDAAIKSLMSSEIFIKSDDESKILFNWIDDEGRIQRTQIILNDSDGKRGRSLVTTSLLKLPDSENEKLRNGVEVLGNVEIIGNDLKIFATSVERYTALKDVLTEIIDVNLDQSISESFIDPNSKEIDETADTPDESEYDFREKKQRREEDADNLFSPEKIREWAETQLELTRIYEKWIDEKVPALENLTPREAVKNPAGKNKVKEMIREWENMSNKELNIPMNMLRKRLEIEEYED